MLYINNLSYLYNEALLVFRHSVWRKFVPKAKKLKSDIWNFFKSFVKNREVVRHGEPFGVVFRSTSGTRMVWFCKVQGKVKTYYNFILISEKIWSPQMPLKEICVSCHQNLQIHNVKPVYLSVSIPSGDAGEHKAVLIRDLFFKAAFCFQALKTPKTRRKKMKPRGGFEFIGNQKC